MSDQVQAPHQSAALARQARLMRLATYASVSVALVLIVVKTWAWIATGSVSLLSSLLDSLLDAAASLINLFAVRHALSPPDREHRFGHGKAEPLAALGQSAFVAGSAIFLFIEAGQRLYEPQQISNVNWGIAVMVFSIVMTFALTRFQAYVVKHTQSVAIQADALHYLGDLLVNGAVIVALVLVSQLGWVYADPVFGIAIAVYILYIAWRIVWRAMDMLMDRELPDEARERITQIVLADPKVLALHDLRTRASGPRTFIQLHLVMDGQITLYEAHQIADNVEAKLCAAFPEAEVLIHQDPDGLEEPPNPSVTL